VSMTTEQALEHLSEQTAGAVAETLQMFSGQEIEIAGVAAIEGDVNPVGALEYPAVVSNVAYLEGVSGGNLFAITAEGAKALAAFMMGGELEDDGSDVPELALSAVGEAANQMLAAAAAATSKVLGEVVEIDPPSTRVVASAEEAMQGQPMTQHVMSVSFSVLGHQCRLVQLVPASFVVKMQYALEERASEVDIGEEGAAIAGTGAATDDAYASGDWLRESKLRLSVELGRARMTAARSVGMGPGSIVELDRQADEPVDLYVNGAPFARGRLLLVGGTDWAVRIESFHNQPVAQDH
jgi:flagellar motor switch protein FliN/FliY